MTTFLFIFSSPMEWVLVAGVVFMLFGASKLPQLAKSIGQSKKAFQEGLREADAEEELAAAEKKKQNSASPPQVSELSDEALIAEMRRRAEAKQIN
ncbi:MAG: twin-arginine translocase TatA/TatE family subunit [Pyrinomonadaceae bacterium]